MAKPKRVGHIVLNVKDLAVSTKFYTEILGFQVVKEIPPAVLLANGGAIVGIHPAPDPARAPRDDRFDENRIGLDHLAYTVESRADLEQALALFEERGVPHGAIEV